MPSTESKGPVVVSNDQQQSAQPIPQAPPAPPSEPIQTASPPPPPPPVAISTVPTVIQEGIDITLYYFIH